MQIHSSIWSSLFQSRILQNTNQLQNADFLEKVIVTQLVKKLTTFMEPRGSMLLLLLVTVRPMNDLFQPHDSIHLEVCLMVVQVFFFFFF